MKDNKQNTTQHIWRMFSYNFILALSLIDTDMAS